MEVEREPRDSCDLNTEKSMRLIALDLAKRGFHVFPVKPNSKIAAINDWTHKATRDEKAINSWWKDPVLGIERDYNIGILTTRFGEDEGLLVVDVDTKNGHNGFDDIVKLELDGFSFPTTYTQKTPSGGEHLAYRVKKALRQGTRILGPGVDTRSNGGYIVGCGSTLEGKRYTCNLLSPVQAPEWLIQKCGEVKEKRPQIDSPGEINKQRALDRAIHYLQNEAKFATPGERNHVAFQAAARLKDFGVAQEECLNLMLEYWPCEPMLDHEELGQVVQSAYKYGIHPVGVDAPEKNFPPIEPGEKELSYLEKMNREYALIYIEDSHFILHETIDEKGRMKRSFLKEATFKRRFSPNTVQQGKGKAPTWAEVWLDWEKRREYAGLCFAPEREARNNYYNLWSGFSVEPLPYEKANSQQRAGFDAFIAHARENVCQNNEEYFTWLIGYFAHLVQKPFERPLTTLVFRGGKGTGKNALVDRIGFLLGSRHYLVAHDGRYLTSNFNGHLDSCLCLVLDEAFWSGDKSAEGKLKGITTAPEILIERKGKEPYTVDNFVRLIVIGNEHWLVPASFDERRYAVFDIGDGKKQQTRYFEQMRINMDDHGGSRVLLHYLKTFDLSLVDVNIAPKTEALLSQKTESLDPFYAFWLDCLERGEVSGSDFEEHAWPESIGRDAFRNVYRKYHKERNIRARAPDDRQLGRMLKTCLPQLATVHRERNKQRYRDYRFPTLIECRQAWENFIGQKMKWEE